MKNLPARIKKDFEEMQHKGELIALYVQLAVITFFLILYHITPEGFSPDAPVKSIGLGLYLLVILVLVRFWFTYTKQLSKIFLTFSVILEMGVLIFTLWTYHIQFEEKAIINLKNSHFHYVYIIIALRALRFEPVWVILSGLTAVIGWTLVIFHAVMNADDYSITWDYVTYATSGKFYPVSEFDKLLTVSLVTIIISYAIKRARDTLKTSILETNAKNELSLFFDKDIASRITTSDIKSEIGNGTECDAAILFTDMRGFTKESLHLTPKELIELLSEYQGIVIDTVRKYGGHIDKFIGDGILISFGTVNKSFTYAADSLSAIDDILEASKNWKNNRMKLGLTPLEIGCGASTGRVVLGTIGYESRLEYTVIGEAVNLAAKLEKHNKKERVQAITDIHTYTLAKKQGYVPNELQEIRRNKKVDGIDNKIDIVTFIKQNSN